MVRGPGRRVQPLLDRRLHLRVERRRDPVATGVDLVALVDREIRAEDAAELAADLQDELRGAPVVAKLRRQDERIALRRLVLVGRVLRGGQRAAGLHQVEDVVATLVDLGRVRDLEADLLRVAVVRGDVRCRADLLRVPDEVVGRRRLGDRREDGHLGERQVLEVLPEVRVGRCLHAVALVAVEVLVQVGGDDLLLPDLARIGLGEAERLDDLADLPLLAAAVERLGGQETRSDQLLGDRRAAARPALEGVDRRGHEAGDVEARVGPEILVLDRGRRIEQLGRQLGERHQLALELTEPGEDRLVGPVADRGLLVEDETAQGVLGVGQSLAVVVVGGGDRDQARQADQQEDRQEQDGDRDEDSSKVRRATRPSASEAAPMALSPREAGLHVGPHDSIGVVEFPPLRTVETARPSVV